MRTRQPFSWPQDKARALRRAVCLEWATLFFMTTIVVAMYFALGSSQAMKAAWIEDMLGLVPATAFLIARHFEKKPPSDAFPFGFFKGVSIAYLVSATALVLLALYMIYDSAYALIIQHHPTIGLVEILGVEFWMGWLMIAVLVYSIIPPVILGRMKKPVARQIHDPVLMADSAMQQADWMTAAAAIIGIIGVGFGFWWADSVAAILISLDVLNDGRKHLVRSVSDLADHSPRRIGGSDADPALDDVRQAVLALDWVADAEILLRSEGHIVTGSIIVRPLSTENLAQRLDEAKRVATESNWHVHEPTVTARL